MEEKYLFEKEYSLTADAVREGYKAFQKRFVMKKSYIFTALFLVLAADFIHAAFKNPGNYLCYLLIAVCLAFAAREWYNPRRTRRAIVEAVSGSGAVYRISLAESYADIATVSAPAPVEVFDADGETVEEPLPEPSRIKFDSEYRLDETDICFCLYYGKNVFYIVPKDILSADETEMLRSTIRGSAEADKN
jgi:hypothetical protein